MRYGITSLTGPKGTYLAVLYPSLAKLKLINTLNKLGYVKTFVKTKQGYKVTGAEGYVAIDKLGGDAVKIVDRMEFSYNNFSQDILKGWDKPGR